MVEKSGKHLYIEGDVFPLQSLNSPSCINLNLEYLCNTQDATISI